MYYPRVVLIKLKNIYEDRFFQALDMNFIFDRKLESTGAFNSDQ